MEISTLAKDSSSYLFQLPTLGPLQLIQKYIDGPGKPGVLALNRVKPFTCVRSFDIKDDAPLELRCTTIRLDGDGNYLVANRTGLQVLQSDGTLVRAFAASLVHDIAIGSNGYIYICNRVKARVEVYSPDGILDQLWEIFSNPKAIAVDNEGKLVIIDSDGEREVRIIDTHMTQVRRWPLQDGYSYESIAVDPVTGNFAICEHDHVSLYQPDGTYVDTIGKNILKNEKLFKPQSVAFDAAGNVVVACENHVQVFAADGSFCFCLDEIQGPSSVAVDADGRIIVRELRGRISVWAPD